MEENPNMSPFTQEEKEMNEKILALTIKIQTQYPEIGQFLDEIPITIPRKDKPKVLLGELTNHYEYLTKILQKYIKEKTH
jgi:hypothetical protein